MGNDSFLRQLWRWLTGSGGTVLAVCFFLPFVAISCDGGSTDLIELSAFELAQGFEGAGSQPVLYLVILGGVLGGLAAFTPEAQRRVGAIIAMVCAGIVIAALFITYTNYNSDASTQGLLQLSTEWRIGLYGMILGIALLLAGSLLGLFMQGAEISYDYPPGPAAAIPPTVIGVPPSIVPLTEASGPPSNIYPPVEPPIPPSQGGYPTAPRTGPTRQGFAQSVPPQPTVADSTPRHTRGWLMVIGGATGREYPLEQRTIIGRDGRRARVVLDDPRVSSEHAAVVFENNRFVLHDLASTNGTYWNGNRVSGPRPLMDGDKVRVGQVEFVFKEVH